MAPKDKLTPRELEIMIAVFSSFKDPVVKIDYNKLATVAGFKNGSTASVVWGNIKRKVLAGATPTTPGTGSSENTPKKPRGKKVVLEETEATENGPSSPDDGADDETLKTEVIKNEEEDLAKPAIDKKPTKRKAQSESQAAEQDESKPPAKRQRKTPAPKPKASKGAAANKKVKQELDAEARQAADDDTLFGLVTTPVEDAGEGSEST